MWNQQTSVLSLHQLPLPSQAPYFIATLYCHYTHNTAHPRSPLTLIIKVHLVGAWGLRKLCLPIQSRDCDACLLLYLSDSWTRFLFFSFDC